MRAFPESKSRYAFLFLNYLRFIPRNRAAIIESYVDSLTAVHKQFDWPYPAVTQQGPGANLPTSPKPLGMTGRSGKCKRVLGRVRKTGLSFNRSGKSRGILSGKFLPKIGEKSRNFISRLALAFTLIEVLNVTSHFTFLSFIYLTFHRQIQGNLAVGQGKSREKSMNFVSFSFFFASACALFVPVIVVHSSKF